MSNCPGLLEVAAHFSGETDATTRGSFEQHLEGCPSCRTSLDEMQSNAERFSERKDELWSAIDQKISSDDSSGASRRKRKTRGSLLRRVVPISAALAVAAALALVLLPQTQNTAKNDGQTQSTIRYKGTLGLRVVAQRGDRQFSVSSNDELTAGDEVRFVLVTTQAGYVDVFSVDCSGTSTPFYPEANPDIDGESWPINRAGRHELPGGVLLDSTEGTEYFIVAFSATPLDRKRLHDEAAALVSRGASAEQLQAALRRMEPAVEILPISKVHSQ